MDNTTAIAWAAGLYEGEGTIVYGATHNGPIRVKISSTDKDVLDLLIARTGFGLLYGPTPPNGFGKKPFYTWVCNGHKTIEFLNLILPFLGERRTSRIKEKIALWDARPMTVRADAAAMREDRATGMTYADIGKKHGVSTSRAFQVCRDGSHAPRRWAVAPAE